METNRIKWNEEMYYRCIKKVPPLKNVDQRPAAGQKAGLAPDRSARTVRDSSNIKFECIQQANTKNVKRNMASIAEISNTAQKEKAKEPYGIGVGQYIDCPIVSASINTDY